MKEFFVKSFRDLEVFKKSYKISLEIHKVTLGFPQIEQRSLADQLRRCSKSICANIAEGFGKQKYSSAEYRRFLSMAVGSCNEMCVWLQYCIDLGYISPNQFEDWSSAYEVLARMLVNLIKSWQGK